MASFRSEPLYRRIKKGFVKLMICVHLGAELDVGALELVADGPEVRVRRADRHLGTDFG